MELLQRINSLEESSSKHEIEAQTISLKNTKLEMRIQALETELEGTNQKYISLEKDSTTLTNELKDMSEKLKKASMDALDLEQNKKRVENENESKLDSRQK